MPLGSRTGSKTLLAHAHGYPADHAAVWPPLAQKRSAESAAAALVRLGACRKAIHAGLPVWERTLGQPRRVAYDPWGWWCPEAGQFALAYENGVPAASSIIDTDDGNSCRSMSDRTSLHQSQNVPGFDLERGLWLRCCRLP